jgi:hypothetical protein
MYYLRLARPALGRRRRSFKDPANMNSIVSAVFAAMLLSACTWQTNRALLPDDPDDKAIHTGSHIPVKENTSVGKASNSGDADAMIRSQKVLGAPAGIPASAGRSN